MKMPSRRLFIRSAGLLTGGAWVYGGLDPEARAFAWQAQAKVDPTLEKMRAQMGSAPIDTTSLGDRLVMLSGPGGNVVVLHGTDGKVVVDTFLQPAWPRLKTVLDGLDTAPVKVSIDTHWHFDHTDNNASFRKAGAAVVAHENTKRRMSEPHDLLGMHFDPSPADALPTQTFASTHSLSANGERIALSHVPPAHTDTDIIVQYTKANVLHLGDLFFNGMYPFIDVSTAGNINGMIGAAERALSLADAQTRIVPGHGPLADRSVLDQYRNMLTTVRDRVRAQKAKGQTLAQVQAAKPTAEFDAAYGKGMLTPNDFISLVFNTL
jgi:glyoxylase-like metal-dependent hydrolase (beta-lactamase superfamily II)